LEEELKKLTSKDVKILISEIKRPELDALLVSENIAQQLVGRISFRRAMKQAVASAMRMGAQGVRIMCSGRLGGAEMARTEQYKEGRIPLHTLRADIDYGVATANTIYGSIGVKVWICKGEVIGKKV
jgi:small subunit ribosomal protein S3